MKTKHTPGPWQTMNSHKPGFMDIVSLGDDQPQNRKWICEIGPSDTSWEDANLISAAPKMLEALRGIKDLAKYSHNPFGPDIIKICDTAIAEAIGE